MKAAQELRRGWRLVLAALCGITFGVTGLFFYSAGIFLKPVAAEFGWTRAATSAVILVGALTLAVIAPFVGQIADRVGTRTIALGSSVGLALGFLLLSHAPASLPVYLSFVVIAVLLGAGASPVVYTRLINQWFDRARGTALGLAQMATGIAATLMPPLLLPYVARHGWRSGYESMGLCVLASAPLVFLLIGPIRSAPVITGGAGLPAASLSLANAVRTPAFLTLVTMLALAAVGVSGIIVHLVPMLSDAGVPAARASAIAGLLGIGVIAGRALTGVLMDRIFAPRVAFGAFIAAACGCWLLSWGGAPWAVPATVLTGFAMGAEVDLISYLVARYYGLSAYGRIYGWLYAVFMVGTSLGPIAAGAAFDHFGNYRIAAAALGGLLALAALVSWRLPRFEGSGDGPASHPRR